MTNNRLETKTLTCLPLGVLRGGMGKHVTELLPSEFQIFLQVWFLPVKSLV